MFWQPIKTFCANILNLITHYDMATHVTMHKNLNISQKQMFL